MKNLSALFMLFFAVCTGCAESEADDNDAVNAVETTTTTDQRLSPNSLAPPDENQSAQNSGESSLGTASEEQTPVREDEATQESVPSEFSPVPRPSQASTPSPDESATESPDSEALGGQMSEQAHMADASAQNTTPQFEEGSSATEESDPNILCNDQCDHANDGMCNDEIIDYSNALRCIFGTDCTDCGERRRGSNQTCSLDASDPCPPACNDPCPSGETCRNDLRCHP